MLVLTLAHTFCFLALLWLYLEPVNLAFLAFCGNIDRIYPTLIGWKCAKEFINTNGPKEFRRVMQNKLPAWDLPLLAWHLALALALGYVVLTWWVLGLWIYSSKWLGDWVSGPMFFPKITSNSTQRPKSIKHPLILFYILYLFIIK